MKPVLRAVCFRRCGAVRRGNGPTFNIFAVAGVEPGEPEHPPPFTASKTIHRRQHGDAHAGCERRLLSSNSLTARAFKARGNTIASSSVSVLAAAAPPSSGLSGKPSTGVKFPFEVGYQPNGLQHSP